MTHSAPDRPGTTRRTLVAAAGATGLVAALAACGSDDGKGSKETGPEEQPGTTTPPATGESPKEAQPKGEALARASEIPVGGGKVFADRKVVVTQPVKGEFKAFSAVCTHQGCVVKDVSDGTINCPCHGSKFSAADGSVRNGPARQPLPGRTVTVRDDSVQLG
ncbi:Rieske (2Fe-2S) protein [Streptomyces sp. ISL-11]|uniref:Rieske (2Fe-2S) protein n=1 Tax=Streptomyces sp. ISL-11 TaxID=2819174 RepID=UPI001BECBF45|nr:Rieske (2Fe-2S) protein [Streptomyces sp. ISL-11]MBT2387297.1 Rieske (2Fe-2S) protein [Streptomyces sp. ISL-11]